MPKATTKTKTVKHLPAGAEITLTVDGVPLKVPVRKGAKLEWRIPVGERDK